MSVTRRFRVIDGEVREVTERDTSPVVDRGPMVGSAYGQSKPGKSIAMSVHPDDCARMNEELRKRGIQGVHYDPTKRDTAFREGYRQGRTVGMNLNW